MAWVCNYVRFKGRPRRKLLALEQEANQFITATLLQLAQLKLERQVHSKAVREFSQAVSSILKAYQKQSISYEQAKQLFKNLKLGLLMVFELLKRHKGIETFVGNKEPLRWKLSPKYDSKQSIV